MAPTSVSIADLVKGCLNAFKELSHTLVSTVSLSVSRAAWEDEAGRLRIWSGNLGAHQTGSSSLAYRLRHAPSVEHEITSALQVLLQAVEEVTQILDDSLKEDGIDEENVSEIYKDVVDSVQGLFRLGTVIRNPSRRDQILERSQYDKNMEPYDKTHVRDMLPQASAVVVERLDERTLKGVQTFGLDSEDSDDDTKSKLSGTVATDLVVHAGDGQDDGSISVGASATSYASSLFNGSTRRFPTKPNASTPDGRFECPLCFYLIETKDTMAWRKHVLMDLQPYVCLYPHCSHADRLFTSRREWYAHEVQQHVANGEARNQCPLCGATLSEATAEKHLGRHLEDIALFTLPSALFGDEETDQAEQESDSETSAPDASFQFVEAQSNSDELADTTRLEVVPRTLLVDSYGNKQRVAQKVLEGMIASIQEARGGALPCELCGSCYWYRGDLVKHMEIKHGPLGRYVICTVRGCGYRLRRDNIGHHIRKKHGLKNEGQFKICEDEEE